MNSIALASSIRSLNYFITDIDQVDIIKIKNFNKIKLPDGILKVENPTKTSEIEFKIDTLFEFNEIILSISPHIYKGDIITSSVIVDDEEFSFGNFSFNNSTSFSKENKIGKMNIDTLTLNKKTNNIKIKIKIFTNSDKHPLIKLINVVLTDKTMPYKENSKKTQQLGNIKLNIPKISQMIQQTEFNQDICSPTSLTMVLNYYGIKIDTPTVALNILDNSSKIYGNWLFNTMFASTKGLFAFVARINSLYEMQTYLSKKIPIIASITFGPNELKNSPIKKTKGHLVVIKGIDEKGNIIVNDPAAIKNDKVEIVYKRNEFENAWIKNKFGTSYIIIDDIFKLATGNIPFSELKTGDENTLTQFGIDEYIKVIEKKDDKYLIELPEQKTTDKNKLVNYKGYTNTISFRLPQKFNAIISKRNSDKNIPIGTRFSIIKEIDDIYLSYISNYVFFIKKSNTNTLKNIEKINLRNSIIDHARQFLGLEYYWGGRSENHLDCSGLVQIVYKMHFIDLPRNAHDQFIQSMKIKDVSKLQIADLIFSKDIKSNYIDHVMIYSGNGKIIESTKDSNNVREIDFYEKFGKKLKDVKYQEKLKDKIIYFGSFIKNKGKK